MTLVSDLTERELIARIQSRLPPSPSWMLTGIGDDAAVIQPERNRAEALTVDALVEGIHFDRRFTPSEAIGHRALAVNLSDLAAMGAAPRVALLSFALPPALSADAFEGIVAGVAAIAGRYGVHVAGGNLTRSPGPLMVDVTMIGVLKPRQALLRSGARPGDVLYVTGAIGAAAAGLQYLQASMPPDAGRGLDSGQSGGQGPHPPAVEGSMEACVTRYWYPEPRVRVGLLLGRNGAASACMDLSDGLADAVRQVGGASGVGAILDATALPIETGARTWFERRGTDPVDEALSGGDDYELLFAVRPRLKGRLTAALRHGGVPLTRVGVCTEARDFVVRRDGRELPLPAGFSHFR
jgi:thiamine-monophosphate kinase